METFGFDGDLLFHIGLDAISITDMQTGRFLDVNGAWERQYGYTRAEAVGHMGPKDVSAEVGATQNAIAQVMSGGSVCRHVRWHKNRQGAVFPVEIHAGKHTLRGREVMVAMIRDVSERVRLETQLRQADRMASVGTLAAGVAHEINNPLSWVMNNLEHLERALSAHGRGEPLDARALAQVVEEARDGAKRVRQIVRDLKTFSRPEEEHTGPVDVADALNGSLRLLANPLRHRAVVRRELSIGQWAQANDARLGQVFVNLLANALDALPERPREQNVITVCARPGPAGFVVAEVRDNGKGISPDIHARIFDPFFSTRPVGEGTGLGLSICQGIVSSFGGRIEVESVPGEGSTFRVVLPAAQPPTSSATAHPHEGDQPRDVPLRLLLVDDERNLGRALMRALEPEVELSFVTDAQEGLQLIARGEPFDAVVCDLMMPAMSGMEFYEALQNLNAALASRCGFITGGTFTQPARDFAARMEGRIIEKPFLAADLQALVSRLVDARS